MALAQQLKEVMAVSWKKYRLIIVASAIFLAIQFIYSWLMWHRSGNLPPTPDDSYNYIVSIHQIAIGGSFMTFSAQIVYSSYNYIYSLFTHIFGLSPLLTYHIFFYLAKIILLGVIIYFLGSLTSNQKLLAALIVTLSVYAGTGDAHGFFWVVPSFWSVLLFLILIGMAMRKVHWYPLAIVAVLFMFVHPLSVYTIVPIFLTYIILKLIKSDHSADFGRLLLVLLVAAIIQQGSVFLINNRDIKSDSASSLVQVSSVLQGGVLSGVDPSGNTTIGQLSSTGSVSVGILSVGDIVSKLRSTAPQNSYTHTVNVPKSIYRVVPSLYELWNAYGFLLVLSPILGLALLAVFGLMFAWGIKGKDTLTILFLSVFATTLGALIHPQGFRFIVFLWPLTLIALANYLWHIANWSKMYRYGLFVLVCLYLIGQLLYGLFLTHRVSLYDDYHWNKSCATYLVNKRLANPNMVLFYSGYTLAPTVFIGEGLYNTTAISEDSWSPFLSDPANSSKSIVYLNDKADGFAPAGKVEQLNAEISNIAISRGKSIKWTNCGYFKYGEEQ